MAKIKDLDVRVENREKRGTLEKKGVAMVMVLVVEKLNEKQLEQKERDKRK